MDTIAPLLKLSSSAPLRSNARRAAFVEPGDARPGSALLERDVRPITIIRFYTSHGRLPLRHLQTMAR